MAQGRSVGETTKPVSAPMPTPSRMEVIDALKEDLANWMQLCLVEESQLESLEQELMAGGDVDFEAPEVLPEDSFSEDIYETIAPYFVSAKSFLKHVLEKNKDKTNVAKQELHELLSMTHAQFSMLSESEQRKYLMTICVISAAILQDLRVLANKYVIEIDLCMTAEMIKEVTLEMGVNAVTTILFDKALYHPDHQKEFATYRQQLYSSIGAVDLSTHQFFSLMYGHVAAAMAFIKEYKSDIKHQLVENEKGAVEKPLSTAIRFTALPPPVSQAPSVPVPTRSYGCVIL